MPDIPIVVIGYNRPQALLRVLESIKNAAYIPGQNPSLYISLDYSGNEESLEVAESFNWEIGQKHIIAHKERLGLKMHVISCGDLSKNHDGIIMLEDDLIVSPYYYQYAISSAVAFKEDEKVAGISLYSPRFNETSFKEWRPVYHKSLCFFSKVPASSGQMFLKEQWLKFKASLHDNNRTVILPPNVAYWPDDSSWKKSFFIYLISANKYFLYPYFSYSSNCGDVGQHLKTQTEWCQVELNCQPDLPLFNDAYKNAVYYDEYSEMEPRCFPQQVSSLDITIDINGTKPIENFTTEYVLTSKQGGNIEFSYDAILFPAEYNIINEIRGQSSDAILRVSKVSSFNKKDIRSIAKRIKNAI